MEKKTVTGDKSRKLKNVDNWKGQKEDRGDK